MAFLYAPIAVLIVFSFNASKSRSVWAGFSLRWYRELFRDSEILGALKNTLVVATVAAICATILGTLAAIGIHAMNKRARRVVMNITSLPMINPEIVTGVSLMLLYAFVAQRTGLLRPGYGTLILSHITFNLPYVILSVMPKLRQRNQQLYEAAMDLGCNPVTAFFKVLLPEIMPGVVTGLIMAFTLSIDDFVISYFTSGPTSQTLPIAIFSMTRRRVSPEVNALSTLLFVVVMALLVIVNLRQSAEAKRNAVRKGAGSH